MKKAAITDLKPSNAVVRTGSRSNSRRRAKPSVTRQPGRLLNSLRDAIVRVGDGRGFLVRMKNDKTLVITAAHCLPGLPPPHLGSYLHERTYANLLGPLGEQPTLCVECLFVDPVADVAMLCEPDGQELYDECEEYERFVEARPSFRIAAITRRSTAWLLNLDGKWKSSTMAPADPGRMLILIGARILAGMSGSPIVSSKGKVVGIASHEHLGYDKQQQVVLVNNLPVWLLLKCTKALPKMVIAQQRLNDLEARRRRSAMISLFGKKHKLSESSV